jgi:hypothetical protein
MTGGGRIECTYDYRDEAGVLLSQVVRFADPKDFRQRRPNGNGGFEWTTKGTRRVLYRLPELVAAPIEEPIYVCEGEKDVDRLAALGLVATTNPGGASKGKSKWLAEFNQWFAARSVVIVPDNDEAGLAHAGAIAQRLASVAADVGVVDPALLGLADKGDISDWLDAGGTRAELERIAAAMPPWQPSTAATAQAATATDPIAELNKTFAVVRIVNRVAILNEHLDAEGRPTFSLLPPDGFKLWLANQAAEIPTTDDQGNPAIARVPLAPYWIKHPRRREHAGITFAPQGAPPGYFNLWTGFAVQPNPNGSCDLFKQHLLDNVCDGNSIWFNWVFGWFADVFQHPAGKCGTSLALRGDEGVGKTIVGETFGHLLGLHYTQVADPRYVIGRFNAHLVRCLLFHCDEAFWAGDRVAEGKVKDLISGNRHPIELKGFEVFWVPNYVRVFINGNADWLMPAGKGARRPAVLDVADTRKEDIKYFGAIKQQLEAGGYEKLLDELLSFDLSTVDIRHVPKTDALLDQKIASLGPEDAWWLDILKAGQLPHKTSDAKPGKCPGQAIYDYYIEHARKRGVNRRSIETALGIYLLKSVPNLTRYPGTFIIKDADAFNPTIKGRGAIYEFPPLDGCRSAFAKTLQQ